MSLICMPVRSSSRWVASIGPVSISTGSTPTRQVSTTRASGREPERLGLVGRHQQHGAGAVGDLRRRAGGVHAVFAGDGLEPGEASSVVSRRPSSRVDAVGGAGRLALVVEVGRVDRHDLGVEAVLGPGLGGALLGQDAELVDVAAGDAPLLGDALGALELRRELVLREVALRHGLADTEAAPEREPIGTRLMTSTPHATATSTTPEPTRLVARLVACCDEPHWLSTVVAGADIGRPAVSHAVRVMLKACIPTWLTQPPTTWPTSAGSMPDRSMSAFSASASRSAEWKVDRPPPRRPIGVRTASTITTSGMGAA